MKEIIELLGVGEASVRRCFRVMRSDLNMPIEYVAEKKGFGYTQKVTSFPLMTMNESEIGAMIVAQQMLALCEGTTDYETVKKVLKKALLNLGAEFAQVAKAIEGVISFHAIGFNAPAKVDTTLRAQLTRAAADREELEIEHKSAAVGAKWKKVRIQPLHVANVNQAWYLWLDLAETGVRRKYALTRIRNVRRTGKAFQRRAFDIKAELDGMGLFGDGDQVKADARLEFSAAVAPFIMEREWHRSQKITANADGSIVLSMKVAHTVDLECFVLRWAGDVRVLEGKTLRESIRKRALALAEACG